MVWWPLEKFLFFSKGSCILGDHPHYLLMHIQSCSSTNNSVQKSTSRAIPSRFSRGKKLKPSCEKIITTATVNTCAHPVCIDWFRGLLSWSEQSYKQLFQDMAFPCRWLIQVQWGRRGGLRLWAVSVNHTVLPHRRHLSPNTKGFSPWGTLKPISSLTCNPSRSTKNSNVERYHIYFLCKRRRIF